MFIGDITYMNLFNFFQTIFEFSQDIYFMQDIRHLFAISTHDWQTYIVNCKNVLHNDLK